MREETKIVERKNWSGGKRFSVTIEQKTIFDQNGKRVEFRTRILDEKVIDWND